MKIVMLTLNQLEQGTYFRAFTFGRALSRQGHDVTLLATAAKNRFQTKIRHTEGIEIIETPDLFTGKLRSGWDVLVNTRARKTWMRGQNIDVMIAFESRPTVALPAHELQKKGIPLIMDWSDWFGAGGSVEQRPGRLTRTMLRPIETYFENHYRPSANGNMAICSTLHAKALSIGVNPDTLKLIPNGFNVPGWPVIPKDQARNALGFSTSDFLIGYVGSLFPGDLELMFRAFQITSDSDRHVKLLHIGNSNYRLPSLPNVLSTGPVDFMGLAQYLAACDVCWLPMQDNGANTGRFPYKFSNYLAAGKPIVATDVGDAASVIRKHNAGITCLPDPESLASSTLELMIAEKLRKQFSENAKSLAQSAEHSWDGRTDMLLQLINQVL